jgi:hypothetical protein
MSDKITLMLALVALGVMITMVAAVVYDLAKGGSLDDLSADEIARRVGQ